MLKAEVIDLVRVHMKLLFLPVDTQHNQRADYEKYDWYNTYLVRHSRGTINTLLSVNAPQQRYY